MKKISIDLSQERKLVTWMITSTRFLKEILPMFRADYLESGYARLITGWIIEYYEQYKEAPGKGITDIFRSKRSFILDESVADNVSDALRRLSEDWESAKPNNIKYSIVESTKYLKIRSQELLVERLQSSILEGDPIKGEQYIANYKRVESVSGTGASIVCDSGEIISAFMEDDEPLIVFPGDLGKVVGKMGRGDFMSFIAPMKRGKTWWLWYTAETAMYARLKVIHFTLEMTRAQMLRRAWQSVMGQPKESGSIVVPYFFADEEDDERWVIKHKKRMMNGLDLSKVKEIQKKLVGRFRGGDVRIIDLPSRSATVDDLRTHMDILEHYEGFTADVVIVDYADYLRASGDVRGDYRHQLDDIWSGLRRLSLEKNILVVTASQADKISFKWDITKLHVAEDIRKLAHVTSMIALNQRDVEAKNGFMRVAQLVVREGKRVFQQAIVLSCLDMGRINIDSRFANDVHIQVEPEKEEPKGKYQRES